MKKLFSLNCEKIESDEISITKLTDENLGNEVDELIKKIKGFLLYLTPFHPLNYGGVNTNLLNVYHVNGYYLLLDEVTFNNSRQWLENITQVTHTNGNDSSSIRCIVGIESTILNLDPTIFNRKENISLCFYRSTVDIDTIDILKGEPKSNCLWVVVDQTKLGVKNLVLPMVNKFYFLTSIINTKCLWANVSDVNYMNDSNYTHSLSDVRIEGDYEIKVKVD